MANGNLPFPFFDAISQFGVESTALGAQSGMHTGGLVNVVTRSGTNTYHGSAFEFLRNNIINASNFSRQRTRCTRTNMAAPLGKILRDKLFAFAGYQHWRQTQSQNGAAYTIHAANLAGDFSVTDPLIATNSCNSKLVQLKDPLPVRSSGQQVYDSSTFNARTGSNEVSAENRSDSGEQLRTRQIRYPAAQVG